jgi:hypothetical protein
LTARTSGFLLPNAQRTTGAPAFECIGSFGRHRLMRLLGRVRSSP